MQNVCLQIRGYSHAKIRVNKIQTHEGCTANHSYHLNLVMITMTNEEYALTQKKHFHNSLKMIRE